MAEDKTIAWVDRQPTAMEQFGNRVSRTEKLLEATVSGKNAFAKNAT